jgi:hypothetical protein
MLQTSVSGVKNSPSSHRRWDDHFSVNFVFPFTYPNVIQIQNELSSRIVNMVPEAIDRRFEKYLRYFKSLVFLRRTFCLEKFISMARQERIDPPAGDALAESLHALVE